MEVPELVRVAALRKVDAYCERRAPAHGRDQVRAEARVRGDKITIVERRAPWCADCGPEWSAFHARSRTWELFAYDRNERRSHARRRIRRVSAPLCPTCGQPASQALAGPEHDWECRNEACPEFGQAVGIEEPHGDRAAPTPAPDPADRTAT